MKNRCNPADITERDALMAIARAMGELGLLVSLCGANFAEHDSTAPTAVTVKFGGDQRLAAALYKLLQVSPALRVGVRDDQVELSCAD